MSQETVFLMLKYKSLIAVCGFTTKLSLFVSVSAGARAVSEASAGLVQVIGFPRKTSESVVYQLSGTGFQDRNAVSVQRLLGGVNAHLFF